MDLTPIVVALLSGGTVGGIAAVIISLIQTRKGSPEQQASGAAAFEADTTRMDRMWDRIDEIEKDNQDLHTTIRVLFRQLDRVEAQVISLGGTPIPRPQIPLLFSPYDV